MGSKCGLKTGATGVILGFGHEVVSRESGWRQMGFTSLEETKRFQPVSWQG